MRAFLLHPATWGTVAAVFLATMALTRVFFRYAARANLLDVPNARSSHSVPTPRGGGIAIAGVLLSALTAVGWRWGDNAGTMVRTLVTGGLLVAAVGWVDDCRPMPARVRLLAQAIAAAWAVFALRGLGAIDLGWTHLPLHPILGGIVAIIAIVWMSNLTNFMDGIDGLVASETVMVAGVAGVFLAVGGSMRLALVAWMLAAAAAGFLVWNWHPATVFMGDVGSVLMGYALGVLALATE